tara:strand:+ start:465 stop:1361 length:897 start_codon:yes stop_codon:yes gene_type:complete
MEEKQLEQTNENVESKVEHEAEQVEETQSLLEPTPYQNKYKQELDKENSDDTATVSKDTSSEEEATPNEERPVNAEDKVFKKRYDDLKRHYDSTISKHRNDVSSLKEQLAAKSSEIIPPKNKKELETWRLKYPDVYDTVKSIAMQESQEQAKAVEGKLKNLQEQTQNVAKEKAEVELMKLHPDFQDIRKTEDFHEWAKEQDPHIQGWLYDNADNANLAGRAIDLYKMDKKFPSQKKESIKNAKAEAAKAVTSTKRGQELDTNQKKIWSISEITKLKPVQYLKHEKDIDLARKEGRIRN